LAEQREEAVTDLVRQATDGNREARQQLYHIFVQRIFNFVMGMVRVKEDAEDITQDSFVLALRNLSKLKEPARFEQWLYRIARNEVYQRYRRKKASHVPLDDNVQQQPPPSGKARESGNPEEEVLRDELGRVVEQALQSLPPKLREVFILSVLHQKSYQEIAEIVGRSLLSVKTDIYRARVFAKDSIKRYLF
jgi:RNA polymerase sigma-70 factor (ECF subfamily)